MSSLSLSALRKTELSTTIATKEWTEDNFLPLSAQVRQAWYGECGTAQSTKAKTVEIPGITELQTGLQVRIKFTAAQRASSPTLNVNGLGAHPIIRSGTTAVANYEWLAGEVIDLVFDGTNWIVSDGGVATTSYYGYTKLYNGATATSTSYALVPAALNSYSENTVVGAPALLTTSTYSVGDRVRYLYNTYECISDVQTPGAWASISSHFKELDPIQIQIDNLSDAVANIDVPEVEGKFVHLSGDTVSSDFYLKAPDGQNALSGIANSGGKIAIGYNTKAIYANSIAIGSSAEASTQPYTIAIGTSTKATSYYSTAIGHNAKSSADRAIAIGTRTNATAENAIQIGTPTDSAVTNSTANTLQIWDKPLLKQTDGKIFIERIPDLPISSVMNLQTTLDSKLSGVKMNDSNVTVTNGVADLSTVLTAHQSLSDLYVLSGEVVEGLSNVVIPKLDTISGLVEDEVEKVDEISAKFDDYSLTGHTHTSSDITNFPPIPTVNNGTLTIQRNGSTVQTFTANQSTAVSANIIVPTKTSELTNDSGFVVSSDLTKVMEYQGSVTNFSDLPNNANKGDVYNVVSANGDYPPGTNYAWSGTSWDPLGGSIDVSVFATKSDLEDYLPLTGGTVDALTAPGIEASSESTNITANFLTATNLTAAGIEASSESTSITANYLTVTNLTAGGIQVAENTEITADTLSAHSLTAPGLIANEENPHGGLSTTAIDFGDGTYISSANDFALVSNLNKLSSEVVNGLSVEINPKLSVIADAVEEEVAKLDELSGSLSTYAKLSDIVSIPSDLSAFTNSPGYITQQALSGLSDIYELSSQTINGISNVINPKLSTIADKVEEEVAKLDELSGKLSGYISSETDPDFHNWLSGNRISAGTGVSVSANYGIGLGAGALVGSGIAIGLSSTAVAGTAVGRYAKAQTGVAIGISADSSGSNNNGVAIGYSTKTTCGIVPATGALRPLGSSIAIGYQSTALCADSIAIGAPAAVNAMSAIQIGLGTNNTQKSLQVWDYQLLDSNGDIPYARLSASIPAAPDYEARISVLEESLSDSISVLQIINGDEESGIEDLIKNCIDDLSSQIPAVGTLNTTLTASQSTNAAEKLSGTINLHKISKTGSWNDLLNKPSFISSETDPAFHDWASNAHYVLSNSYNIAVGKDAIVYANTSGIAIGAESETVNSGVAVGAKARVEQGNAIGFYATASDGIAIGNETSAFNGIAIGNNSSIGPSARFAYGIAIGRDSYATFHNIAIGQETSAYSSKNQVDTIAVGYKSIALSSGAIALGGQASADVNHAIQLGNGVNNTVSSLQVWDYQLLDSNGDIPYARLSSNIKYRIVTPAQTTSGTSVSATMEDNAINHVSLASTVTTATISFPPKITGYARDFFVRLTITGSTVPAITWQEADGSAIDFDVDDGSWSEIEQGVNILMFTETAQ